MVACGTAISRRLVALELVLGEDDQVCDERFIKFAVSLAATHAWTKSHDMPGAP